MPNKYKFWRLIALGAAAFISFCFFIAIFSLSGYERTVYLYTLIPISIFMIFTIIHQMRFPLDLRIYIIWVYLFSLMAVAYGATAISIMILYCAYTLAKQVRFLNNHRVIKLVITWVLFFACASLQFRLIKAELIESAMELWVSTSAIFMMNLIQNHLLKRINSDILEELQKEDLNEYYAQYSFTERDKTMLNEVLSGCKYEEIAINHNLSLSSVKKRLAYLYKLLGVTCQIDFLIKFAPKSSNSTKVQ